VVEGAAGGVEVITLETPEPTPEHTPEHTMVQLLRRNATLFQAVFALLWALRFTLAAGVPEVPIIVAIAGAAAVRMAFRATPGPKARDAFRTAQGRRFLQPVTRLTIVQIVASIVLPAAAGALGAQDWVMPIVAMTIGLFLIGFSRSLRIPAVAMIGAVATVVPPCLPLVATGDALMALTASTMVAGLLTSMWFCALAARAGSRPSCRPR